jgi:hypothetical protein
MAESCCGKTIDVRALEGKQRRVLITVLAIRNGDVNMSSAWECSRIPKRNCIVG